MTKTMNSNKISKYLYVAEIVLSTVEFNMFKGV